MTRVPTVPRPMTITCPLSPVIRCRPSDSSSRRLTIMLVSMAKKTATNIAPSSIRQMAATIRAGGWPRKEIVAVADRGHGLDGEVGRVQHRDPPQAGGPVGQVQDRGGRDQHHDQRAQGGGHPAVRDRAQHRHRHVPGPPHRAERPGVRRVADLRADPGGAQFVRRREQRDPVPGGHEWSRPGQIAASSPSAGSTATGASAPYSSRREARRGAVVRAARKRSPSSGISWMPDCRHASAMDGADSPATSSTDTSIFASARPTAGVAELDDDPHVGAQLTGQQRRLQGHQVVVEGADDGGRAGQARVGQGGGRPGTGREVRDAPAGQLAGERRIRVVVDDHGGHAGQVELLDDTQADAAQAAHDDVALASPRSCPSHGHHPGLL